MTCLLHGAHGEWPHSASICAITLSEAEHRAIQNGTVHLLGPCQKCKERYRLRMEALVRNDPVLGVRRPALRRLGFDVSTSGHWQADHIIPVAEGGGECGLENYRTLCTPCHKRETRALARRLAEQRRLERFGAIQVPLLPRDR